MKFNLFNLIKLKKAGYKVHLARKSDDIIPNEGSYNTYFRDCVSDSCSKIDIISGKIEVPVGEKFEWSLYTNDINYDKSQYIVTKMIDKY